MNTTRYLSAVAAFFSAAYLNASPLIEYTVDGGSTASTILDAGYTGTDLAWTGMATSGFSSSSSTAYVTTDSLSPSLNSGRYLEFTVNTVSGSLPEDLGFTLDFGYQRGAAGVVPDVAFSLKTSVDGFVDSQELNGSGTKYILSSPAGALTTFGTVTGSLTGLSSLSSVTFRLYPSNNGALTGDSNSFVRYDNIGLSAIPEPGTAAYLFIGALLFPIFRRFRRN